MVNSIACYLSDFFLKKSLSSFCKCKCRRAFQRAVVIVAGEWCTHAHGLSRPKNAALHICCAVVVSSRSGAHQPSRRGGLGTGSSSPCHHPPVASVLRAVPWPHLSWPLLLPASLPAWGLPSILDTPDLPSAQVKTGHYAQLGKSSKFSTSSPQMTLKLCQPDLKCHKFPKAPGWCQVAETVSLLNAPMAEAQPLFMLPLPGNCSWVWGAAWKTRGFLQH